MVKLERGYLVISLDFELMWGNIESWKPDGYGTTHVSHVREVINQLLTLFEKYQVRATFATVGLIMQSCKDIRLPNITPTYKNTVLSPYLGYLRNIKDEYESLFFAPDVIKKLKDSPFVEIGTHTYCHYYCWEEGQTIEQFEADIKIAVEEAMREGIELKSIVFPRNQVPTDYLSICKKYGITSYRGNALKYFDSPRNKYEELKNRICRFVDSYLNIGGNTSYKLQKDKDQILNIPASRFLRPYSRSLSFLDSLRFKRIKKEMEYAALNNEVYHIWWHPHNFGANMAQNLSFLERILETYRVLNNQLGMESMTMNDLCELTHLR